MKIVVVHLMLRGNNHTEAHIKTLCQKFVSQKNNKSYTTDREKVTCECCKDMLLFSDCILKK
jgi:hypothetical protein